MSYSLHGNPQQFATMNAWTPGFGTNQANPPGAGRGAGIVLGAGGQPIMSPHSRPPSFQPAQPQQWTFQLPPVPPLQPFRLQTGPGGGSAGHTLMLRCDRCHKNYDNRCQSDIWPGEPGFEGLCQCGGHLQEIHDGGYGTMPDSVNALPAEGGGSSVNARPPVATCDMPFLECPRPLAAHEGIPQVQVRQVGVMKQKQIVWPASIHKAFRTGTKRPPKLRKALFRSDPQSELA